MRRHRQTNPLATILSVLPVVLLVFASVPFASAAHYQPADAAPPQTGSKGVIFPVLRWLRDSAVETVFGGSARAKERDTIKAWSNVQARFGTDVVMRFNVTTPEEEQAMSKATDQLIKDVWATVAGEYVDVRMRQADVKTFLGFLPESLRQPMPLVTDVAAKVWATYPDKTGRRNEDKVDYYARMVGSNVGGVDNIFFKDYQPMSVIASWMRLLEAMFPTYVRLISVGTSYEGRDIPGIRMGVIEEFGKRTEPTEPRKTVLITGGVHAREWISTSTVNYLIWSFTTAYGKEPLVTKLLQHFDVVFVPVLNPDGYVYTWETDRLWRKSRQETNVMFCKGLDLDHAFGYEWDAVKHKTDPCSGSYGGDEPFQAVEASQLAQWAKNETANGEVKFVGLLDLHSYSQQILFPYSFSCNVDPPNRENLEELAVGLAKAIRLSTGEFYSVASACEGAINRESGASKSTASIETRGGSVIDWFYHEMNAHFSYQVKLRDTGSYGFLLPPENIVPTGEEMFAAMKYFGDYLLGNNGIEKQLDTQEDKESHNDEKEDAEDDGNRWSELRRRNRI